MRHAVRTRAAFSGPISRRGSLSQDGAPWHRQQRIRWAGPLALGRTEGHPVLRLAMSKSVLGFSSSDASYDRQPPSSSRQSACAKPGHGANDASKTGWEIQRAVSHETMGLDWNCRCALVASHRYSVVRDFTWRLNCDFQTARRSYGKLNPFLGSTRATILTPGSPCPLGLHADARFPVELMFNPALNQLAGSHPPTTPPALKYRMSVPSTFPNRAKS